MSNPKKKVEPHPCPVCGKMTTNPKMCSKECVAATLRNAARGGTDKLRTLDNQNICRQCKKPMPLDRYSMYCEECELLIEDAM